MAASADSIAIRLLSHSSSGPPYADTGMSFTSLALLFTNPLSVALAALPTPSVTADVFCVLTIV